MSDCCRLLLPVCLSRTRCSRPISSRDRKARQCRSSVLLQAMRRIRVDVPASDREVHDLPEKVEGVIGVARRGPAEGIETTAGPVSR